MVLIPALNEAENLKDILPSMPTEIDDTEVGVLVVDDGSADDTYDVVAQTGYLVVQNRINRGGGAALRMGYDVLAKAGVKICVTMDADGQHQPEEIKKLVLPIIKDQYDFVIGSRILGHREEDSMFRIMGIYTFGFIISRLLGRKITDPSSGFRAFKMDAISSLRLNEDQFHTSELIIEAVKNKIRTGEVPVTILKRKHGETRKGKEWKYGINFARAIIKAWWR